MSGLMPFAVSSSRQVRFQYVVGGQMIAGVDSAAVGAPDRGSIPAGGEGQRAAGLASAAAQHGA